MSDSAQRECEIFSAALDYAEPTQRAAFLDDACGGDAALRRSVESLLRVHAAQGGLLKREDAGSADSANGAIREGPGTRIGRYELREKIGEGGFGVVYRAEQDEPVRRQVALKIIKPGMDTQAFVTRFAAERQALALMEHPNIARVFDGGATESGRPFFVMELVRGISITRFCDEHRLSAEARLQLFITVCHAVQHAHQKGVIHRDLKPSNILVSQQDDAPMPKVIDFGIVKATSAHLTDQTLVTRFHAFVGTPAYTSPEQMELGGLDVDTRSDIYSLGVLLYELLAGRTPFDADTLARSGLDAMRRTIREVDPPRPSARLATLSPADRTTVARDRGTEAATLSLQLRGDLDWIVMRCLEKDRTHRYDTAEALATDLQRYLRHEPVAARPPSTAYVARKFIGRHRFGFFATTAVAIAVLAGLIASSLLLWREQRALARALAAERTAIDARQTAVDLQHQAEVARADEVKRAARTSLELAQRSLRDGRVADGLAYLVYAARKDPTNPVLAPRLASVLAAHNFILPESPPFECGSRVIAIRFALDGRTFLAGTEDGAVRVFDSGSGAVVREFQVGKSVCWITGSMFPRANDDLFAARYVDNALRIFDAITGRQLGATVQLDPSITPQRDTLGFSPDGRWVFATAPGTGRFWIWDARTGEERLVHSLQRATNADLDFSADGRLLSAAGAGEVQLWSLPDFVPALGPIPVPREPGRPPAALFARISPDGRRLAIIDPSTGIRLHDTATGDFRGSHLDLADGTYLKSWGFSPDGRLVRVGNKTSGILDLDTGQLTALPISTRDEFTLDKSFSRDGSALLVTATQEAVASLWHTQTGAPIAEFALRLPANIRGALSPDGTQVVVATTEGSIHRLRVGRGAARPLVLPRPTPRLPLAFLPHAPARLLWLSADRARVLEVASGREVAGGFAFPRAITDAARGDAHKSPLRPDLKFLLVRQDASWEAWELAPEGVRGVVPLQGDPPANGFVTFSPAADLVAINDRAKIQVWDLRTGLAVGPAINPGWPLVAQSVSFSPDGRRLAAAYILGAPVIWDVATGTPASDTYQPDPERTFAAVQFSPDGQRIVTADYRGEARLWDTASGAPVGPLVRAADMLYSATFAPDGRHFVTRSTVDLRIRDADTAALVGEPIPLLGTWTSPRFSSDSRCFIADAPDGSVHVFDVRTAQTYAEPLTYGTARVSTGDFSPDGLHLWTETATGECRIWSLPPRLPDGAPPPEWLLQLATACAGVVVNNEGQLADVPDVAARIASLRITIAALPADAPLAEWGRWILDESAERAIAPGFTITPQQADALKTRLAGAASDR